MALSFTGLVIPGTHSWLAPMSPSLRVIRRHYAGMNGEAEIFCGTGGRPIRVGIVIHHDSLTTPESIVALLEKFDAKVGNHGTLKEEGNTKRKYDNVTFEGFEQTGDILPDDARTLNSAGVRGYFVSGVLHFYQLAYTSTK